MQQVEYGKSARQVKLLAVAGVLMLAELLFFLTRLPGDNILFIIGLGFILTAAFNKTPLRFMALLQQHPQAAVYLQALGKVFYLNILLLLTYFSITIPNVHKISNVNFPRMFFDLVKYGPLGLLLPADSYVGKSDVCEPHFMCIDGFSTTYGALFCPLITGYLILYLIVLAAAMTNARKEVKSGAAKQNSINLKNIKQYASIWMVAFSLILYFILAEYIKYKPVNPLHVLYSILSALIFLLSYLPLYHTVILKPKPWKFWLYGVTYLGLLFSCNVIRLLHLF